MIITRVSKRKCNAAIDSVKNEMLHRLSEWENIDRSAAETFILAMAYEIRIALGIISE